MESGRCWRFCNGSLGQSEIRQFSPLEAHGDLQNCPPFFQRWKAHDPYRLVPGTSASTLRGPGNVLKHLRGGDRTTANPRAWKVV